MPVDFASLSRAQLDALPRASTVFFFAVGPLEDHGPHLPMGLDAAEAAWLCRRAAERLESEKAGWVGVLMPSLPLGIDSNTTELALTVRPHVLRDWLVDCCRGLERAGFFRFVCFSGHLGPRQLTAIEEAGKILGRRRLSRLLRGQRERPQFISACSPLASPGEVWRSPFWPDPSEHGGARDTGVASLIEARTAAVGGSIPLASGLPEVAQASSRSERWLLRTRGKLAGYWGAPAKADPAHALRDLEERLGVIFPKLRAAWEGSNSNLLFRSYYSVLPPNQSFFRAWVLFGCVLIIMLLWMLVTIPTA